MLIEQCKQLIAESKSLNAEKQEHAESSVEVLIPTVYPFPSPGVVLALSFVLFSGWYIGSDVSLSDYPTLIIAGLPSLFAGTLITMPFLLDLVRLPSDLYQVFISIDVITTRFSTFVAAMHYAAVGLIGSMAMVRKLRVRWLSLLKVSLVGVVLISVVLVGVRTFYSHIVVAPYTIADALRGFQFLVKPQPSTIYDSPVADNQQGKPVGLSEIETRGVLRICYQPDEYPSSFFNTNTPAELVGFDIEMAHRFAQELQLPIEFYPAADEKQAAQKLNHGICDIYMRTLLIATDRARLFALTTPVYSSALGLIVKDYQRDQLRDWSTVKNHRESLRLGVENSPGAIRLMKSLAPETILVPIQSIQEQMEMLEAGTPGIDAISDMAEEGAAQTLLYPSYSVVIPKPVISIPVAYAVAKNNDDLLIALNAWIVAEKSKGTVERLYQHWMLGDALQAKRTPRWSVIKDVLGWAE